MMHHQQGPQSFEVQYLGAAMLTQGATGLGTLQKPLKDLYYAFQRPTGPIHLNSNLLTITDKGMVVSQLVPGHVGLTKGAEVFYGMPFIQFWDVVQFVCVKEKEKKFKCAFEPLNFDQNRPRDNLFTPMDYKKDKHLTTAVHPVLFAIVLRRTTGLKALDLHAFVCVNDQQAFDLARSLSMAHAAHSQVERNETGVYGYNQFSESESILFSGGTPLSDSGVSGVRLPPSRPINQQHPMGFSHMDPMPGGNGGFTSDIYGNMKQNPPGPNMRNPDPIYGNGMAPGMQGNKMGYELSQNDFRKDPRDQQIYGGFPVYGNSAALNPPGQQKTDFLSRSQNNIYQSRDEVLLDQPKLQRHAYEEIYGQHNNIGASKSLERPNQPTFPVNQAQNNRNMYDQFNRDGIYGQSSLPKDNSGGYGIAVYNVGKKFDDPPQSNNMKESAYGFVTKTDVNPVGQKFDDHVYGNSNGLMQKPANPPPTNFVGFGASNFSRPANDEPPTRHPGTSPSYRRKFPGGGDFGKNNWEANAAAKPLGPSKPAFGGYNGLSNQKAEPAPQSKPVFGGYNGFSNQKVEPAPEIEYKPLPHIPSRDISAPQPPPVQPPPPVEDDSVPLGARKSVFGIFPREPEKSSKAPTPAAAKYVPPAAPEPSRYIPAAVPAPSRDRQFSGGEMGDRPVALVQPRKVTGIRVLPFGDELNSKLPAKRDDQYRPQANEFGKSSVPAQDDPDRPTKDKEIASMFGNLNVDNSNAVPSKINLETALGYLP